MYTGETLTALTLTYLGVSSIVVVVAVVFHITYVWFSGKVCLLYLVHVTIMCLVHLSLNYL